MTRPPLKLLTGLAKIAATENEKAANLKAAIAKKTAKIETAENDKAANLKAEIAKKAATTAEKAENLRLQPPPH